MKNRSSYQAAYRQTHKEQRKVWYEAHREEQRVKDKAYYNAHKAERKEYYQKRKEKIKAVSRAYNDAHKDELKEYRRRRTQALKLETFQHYSGEHPKCAHCNNDNLVVLTIDHINEDGAKQRREIGMGNIMYKWLRKHNYPVGYQVLCFNCNIQKYHSRGITNVS